MTCLKVNKEELQSIKQELYDIRHTAFLAYYDDIAKFQEAATDKATSWDNSYNKWQNFKDEASSQVNLEDYRKKWLTEQNVGEKFNFHADYNYDAYYARINEIAKEMFDEKVKEYKDLNSKLRDGFYDSYKNTICKVVNNLGYVISAINTFENNSVNNIDSYLSEDYLVRNADVIAFAGEEFVQADGKKVEISSLKMKSEDGGLHDIGEDVNCLYARTVGTAKVVTVAAIVAANSEDFQNLKTDEARWAYINNVIGETVEATDETFDDWYDKGYFAATTQEEFAELYEDLTGMEYDPDAVNAHMDAYINKFGFEDEADFEQWLLSGAGSVLTPFMVNKALEKNGPLTDEELEQMGLHDVVEGRAKVGMEVTAEDDDALLGAAGGSGGADGSGVSVKVDEFGESESEPGPLDDVIEETEAPVDPEVKDPNDGVIPDNRTSGVLEDPIPDPPGLDNKMDNATADRLAEERFYDQFTPEQLADYRNNQRIEYEGYTIEEATDFFSDAGYSLPDAKFLAENKELGITAFLAAKQSADMADMSRQIAQSANMDMTMFDTKFDDGASYQDLVNGNTKAFLTNPNSDPNVSNAKQSMTNAKSNYDSAVDKANKSVNEANENKEKLDSVKKDIVKKSGKDTSKWSDEDVEQYNEAVNKYNDSVKQANEDVANAQNAKTEYDNSKTEYENSKEEFYEKIKEEEASTETGDGNNDLPNSDEPNGEGTGSSNDAGNSNQNPSETPGNGGHETPEPPSNGGNDTPGSPSNGGHESSDTPSGGGQNAPEEPSGGNNESSNNDDLIPDIPSGESDNNPGSDGTGFGFNKSSGDNNPGNYNDGNNGNNGNNGDNGLSAPPSNDEYVGVDDSGSGLGIRGDSDYNPNEPSTISNPVDNPNSEYIYIDESQDGTDDDEKPRVSNSGIGF